MHTVSDILELNKRELLSIRPEDSVLEAVQMLSHFDVGALMVMEGKKLVGIFSERDYTRKVMLLKRDAAKTTVKEIMSTKVDTIDAYRSLEDCLQMMDAGQFRHLPVVRSGEVIGFISILDVAKTLLTEKGETIDQLKSYVSETWPF